MDIETSKNDNNLDESYEEDNFEMNSEIIEEKTRYIQVAFGDNGPRKKSFFERLTVLVVLIMLLVTVGALIFQAVAAVL